VIGRRRPLPTPSRCHAQVFGTPTLIHSGCHAQVFLGVLLHCVDPGCHAHVRVGMRLVRRRFDFFIIGTRGCFFVEAM